MDSYSSKEAAQSLKQMRYSTLNTTGPVIVCVGVIYGIVHYFNEQSLEAVYLSWLLLPLCLTMIFTLMFENKISAQVRSHLYIMMLFLMGAGNMHFYGMLGPGGMFLIGSSFLAVLLLPFKQSLYYFGINTFTVISYSFFWNAGIFSFRFDPLEYGMSVQTFISRAVVYILFAVIFLLTFKRVLDVMMSAIERQSEAHETLRMQNMQLDNQYAALAAGKKELEMSEERYRVLVEHSEDLIFSINPCGTIISVNTAFENVLNVTKETVIGKTIFEVAGNEEEAMLSRKSIQSIQENSEASAYKIQYAGRVFNVTLTPVFQTEGEVHVIIGRAHDISEIVEKKQEVERLAYFDQLTNLANRTKIEDEINAHVIGNDAKKCGLLYFDLDNFKSVNDTLGHHAGDELLQVMAERLLKVTGKESTLARIGGDEFILFHRQDNKEKCVDQLAEIGSAILEAVEIPFLTEGKEFQLSASIGAVTFPEHGQDFQTLIKNADAAMYEAKKSGKNQMAFYNEMKFQGA